MPTKRIEPRAHPAPFSLPVLDYIATVLEEEAELRNKKKLRVLDPFAGIGRIHDLPHDTVGVELEPEWAQQHPKTEVGDATNMRFRAKSFDVVAYSPCYGNRMADSHNNKDACKACEGWGQWYEQVDNKSYLVTCKSCKGTALSHRRSYTHYLGHKLSDNSAGDMHWGPKYRRFHWRFLEEADRVLRVSGLHVLNIANHEKTIKGERYEVRVSEWWINRLIKMGYTIEHVARIHTSKYRYGTNRDLRTKGELVVVARKPELLVA